MFIDPSRLWNALPTRLQNRFPFPSTPCSPAPGFPPPPPPFPFACCSVSMLPPPRLFQRVRVKRKAGAVPAASTSEKRRDGRETGPPERDPPRLPHSELLRAKRTVPRDLTFQSAASSEPGAQ